MSTSRLLEELGTDRRCIVMIIARCCPLSACPLPVVRLLPIRVSRDRYLLGDDM